MPKITLSDGPILLKSMTCELESLISISLILASIRDCCSLAAWYSAFSFRSPNSLAVAIASITEGLSSIFEVLLLKGPLPPMSLDA